MGGDPGAGTGDSLLGQVLARNDCGAKMSARRTSRRVAPAGHSGACGSGKSVNPGADTLELDSDTRGRRISHRGICRSFFSNPGWSGQGETVHGPSAMPMRDVIGKIIINRVSARNGLAGGQGMASRKTGGDQLNQ